MSMNSSIGPDDVLCGRGGRTNGHVGNRRFRELVADHQSEYLDARKKDKITIARRIVQLIKSKGGRFLKVGADGDNWEPVPDKKALQKTSQALREGLDVRNKTIRPSKIFKRDRDSDSEDGSSTGRKRSKVVSGKVVAAIPTEVASAPASSLKPPPATVSVSGDPQSPNALLHDTIPELNEEMVFPSYQPPPISNADIENMCGV